MFPRDENRNEGRVCSPEPPFYETALLSPNELWGIPQLSRDTLQKGVSPRCACVKLSTKGGIAPFWRAANLAEKVSGNMGYRSDGDAISRDMGPLRPLGHGP